MIEINKESFDNMVNFIVENNVINTDFLIDMGMHIRNILEIEHTEFTQDELKLVAEFIDENQDEFFVKMEKHEDFVLGVIPEGVNSEKGVFANLKIPSLFFMTSASKQGITNLLIFFTMLTRVLPEPYTKYILSKAVEFSNEFLTEHYPEAIKRKEELH